MHESFDSSSVQRMNALTGPTAQQSADSRKFCLYCSQWGHSSHECPTAVKEREQQRPLGLVTREGVPLPAEHGCARGCKLSPDAGHVHPQCQERSDCTMWPEDIHEAAPIKLAAWLSLKVFNPWPQCSAKDVCTVRQTCAYQCSSVDGVVIRDGRCPWDQWKSQRDV